MAIDDEQKRLAEELLFSEKRKLSFAKSLFFGDFTPLSYPELDDGGMGDKVKQFAADHIDAQWIDQQAKIPEEVIQGLGEMGLLGLTIPKEYGGLGMSQVAYCKAMEELAKSCSSTALFVNAHQSVGLKALLLFGTEEQKKKYLPPLSRGEHIAAFSLTEPNAGSDASGVETRAVYDAAKKCYIINGKKQWTTNGSIAQMLTVMAKTDDKITAFLVTPDMPGFVVKDKALDKVGMRGTKTSNLQFDNLVVPEANILGPKGKGLKICLTVLDYGRTTFGATCTGTAKAALEKVLEYAKSRYQFKRPLSSFELVKKKLVQIAALTYAMEAATYLTAGLVDGGTEDFMLEAAMLKVFASESLWKIIYETMQIYGGKSFFTDHPFERMMRDARLNMIGEGANEVLRAFIAAVGLREVGYELKEKKHMWHFIKRCFVSPIVPSVFTAEGKQLAAAIKRFHLAVLKTIIKYREEVVERQLVLDRLTTAAISIYVATAVLSRMEKEGEALTGTWIFKQMLGKVDSSLAHLFSKGDQGINALADHLTGK
jgi:acyl-CoA dehydrogenase family member 9